MSDRRKTHNGRDRSGHFKVKREDVEDLLTDPDGVDLIRDDVRLGGAVADIGPQGGVRADHIARLVDENREVVDRLTGRDRDQGTHERRGRPRRRR
jgi:hypothetical protein